MRELFAWGVTLSVIMSVCIIQTQHVQLKTQHWQKADMVNELLSYTCIQTENPLWIVTFPLLLDDLFSCAHKRIIISANPSRLLFAKLQKQREK